MAQTLTVKPQYVNTAQVFIDGKSILLNNNLTQEQLLAIWQKVEFRTFIDITYTNVADSFPESYVIDPSLFHAYDSGEVTHDPAKTNYQPNTVGKHLNETRSKIDSFDNSFVRASTRPSVLFDFANGRFMDPRIQSSRTTIGTYVDRNGIIRVAQARKLRYTYHPVTKESLGVIQESRKTNLATYSNTFTHASWTKTRGTIMTSAELAPDANLATKVIEDTTANSSHQIGKGDVPVSANVKYTASIFVKAAERSFVMIQMSNTAIYGGSNPSALVDLGTGSIVSFSNCSKNPTIEAYNNGWYRIALTQVASVSGTSGLNVQLSQNNTPSYTGDGVSGALVFGFQFEEGNFASTYIPTNDVAVLRETDLIIVDGALFTEYFPNVTEGTLLCSAYKGFTNGAYPSYWTFIGPNTTGQNSIRLTNLLADTDMTNAIYVDGVSQSPAGFSVPAGNFFTNIMTWKAGDAKVFNNSNASFDITPSIPKNINAFRIEDVNGIIRQIAFWPKRLDNSVIQLMAKNSTLVGKNPTQMPTVGDLGACAFLRPETLLRAKSRQEFSVDGTGASVTRNIRRDYDFTFEIVDSSGVTLTAQPASSCTAGTDNALTFTAPLGKTLTYAITPVYEN